MHSFIQSPTARAKRAFFGLIAIMKKIIFLAAMALAGCASVHESYAPDGQKAYTLNCSGMARGWDKCYSKAGELCGERGYTVIDRSGESGAVIGGSSNGFAGGTTSERSMVVECKRPG
ncbi:hypothetical protein [Paraburkholderia sp. BR10882]|uniref:hypothetical protein n=1 Tax=unclassified Paraburkholderia TaxID=2615204 RepID=UPI0034CED191